MDEARTDDGTQNELEKNLRLATGFSLFYSIILIIGAFVIDLSTWSSVPAPLMLAAGLSLFGISTAAFSRRSPPLLLINSLWWVLFGLYILQSLVKREMSAVTCIIAIYYAGFLAFGHFKLYRRLKQHSHRGGTFE